VGTIWLATEAERRKEREQFDLAIITASTLVARIADLRSSMFIALKLLPAGETTLNDIREGLQKGVETINQVGLWTQEDLTPLVRLPNHIAARLAVIGMRLTSSLARTEKASRNPNSSTKQIVGIRTIFCLQLLDFREELEPLQHQINAFLRSHGFGS
jgi:hypothetical protein